VNGLRAWLRSSFELGDHNRRVPSMEGLRGLAILLVFASHYNDIIGEHLGLPAPVTAVSRAVGVLGGFGVDLFFLLSGFLIYRTTLRPALNVGAFLMRRAERIYPTFAVVFLAFLALGAVHLGPSRLPGDALRGGGTILANLLFLPGIFDMPAIINAAWSLSYEWFFYLALPIVVLALGLYRWNRSGRIVFLVALCAGYEALCLFVPSLFPTFANYEGSHVRLIMFGSGMIVYELLESSRFRAFFTSRIETACIAIVALSAIFLVLRVLLSTSPQPADGAWSASSAAIQVIPTFIGFGCLALLTLTNDGRLAHLFTATWLRWTGNISYSFYLVHSIPMHFMSLILGKAALHANPVLLYLVGLPVTLALTFAVAALLFVTVEKPLSLRPRSAPVQRPELQIA
jgi:exopolysaccharide production protein ExoZ